MKIKATIDKQELEIEVDEKELVKAGYVKTKKEYERWRANHGQNYYCVLPPKGSISLTETLGVYDNFLYNTGNYYQTEELAQAALDRQLALVRVNDRIMELNEGWEPGIEEEVGSKPFTEIRYSFFDKCFYTWNIWGVVSKPKVDFIKKIEFGNQIISECEDDLKVIFGV